MKLRVLVGSGEKIMLMALPFIIIGLFLSFMIPSLFSLGGPPAFLKVISIVILVAGILIWLWSAALVVTRVPRKKLITNGPYALVKHPIYSSVALLVAPAAGILTNTWLGIALGAVIYIGSRIYAPEEEKGLQKTFGAEWDAYAKKVIIGWL